MHPREDQKKQHLKNLQTEADRFEKFRVGPAKCKHYSHPPRPCADGESWGTVNVTGKSGFEDRNGGFRHVALNLSLYFHVGEGVEAWRYGARAGEAERLRRPEVGKNSFVCDKTTVSSLYIGHGLGKRTVAFALRAIIGQLQIRWMSRIPT